MRITNSAFYGGCGLASAIAAGLAWWAVVAANASGFIHSGRFSPMLSRAIDPVAFQRQYQTDFATGIVFSVAARPFLLPRWCLLLEIDDITANDLYDHARYRLGSAKLLVPKTPAIRSVTIGELLATRIGLLVMLSCFVVCYEIGRGDSVQPSGYFKLVHFGCWRQARIGHGARGCEATRGAQDYL